MVLEGKYERYSVSCSRRSPRRKDLWHVFVNFGDGCDGIKRVKGRGRGKKGDKLTHGWRDSKAGGQKIEETSRGKGYVDDRVQRGLQSIE